MDQPDPMLKMVYEGAVRLLAARLSAHEVRMGDIDNCVSISFELYAETVKQARGRKSDGSKP